MQNSVKSGWIAPLAVISGLALAACQWLIFVYAPTEAQMGVIQKIFYTHMPLAWWGLFSFLTVFVCSIFYLVRKNMFWDELAEAAAEVGVVMGGLALVTGSIWARVSWNTWWTWDPRLSTTLIMWFIYAAYLIVRRMDMTRERRAVVSSVIGIVAFLDVPLVFFSTRLWPQTIHPKVIGGGGMEPEMKTALIASVLCMGLFWAALTAYRYKLGSMKSRLDRLATERALAL